MAEGLHAGMGLCDWKEPASNRVLGMEKILLFLEKGDGMHGRASHSSEHWLVAQCQGVF